MHLSRVGNDDETGERRDHLHHRLSVASRLDNMIFVPQLGGNCYELRARHVHATHPDHLVAVDHHCLGVYTVDVRSYGLRAASSAPERGWSYHGPHPKMGDASIAIRDVAISMPAKPPTKFSLTYADSLQTAHPRITGRSDQARQEARQLVRAISSRRGIVLRP